MELTSFSNSHIKRILGYYRGKECNHQLSRFGAFTGFMEWPNSVALQIDPCLWNGELRSGFNGARGVGRSDACGVMLLQCVVVSLEAFGLSF
ncbi:hypothetical protein EUGRSUZ_G03113 [Eucalyptus grandis]|uniref:Uncharacterized protein n=2 Tax=Eucalyptus grandis TaxID=71139 RepID=A0ACC3KAX8_EUCGR|nr:hypothetical protein EUGRSUZ_G03113 [Eucalyptus grandis]